MNLKGGKVLMKIITRIIETILAFVVLFTGFAVFSVDDCSCGHCYDDAKMLAKIILLTGIVLELVIILIKARTKNKTRISRSILEFIITIFVIIEMFLALYFILQIIAVIGDGFTESMTELVNVSVVIAVIALIIYILNSASKYEEPKENESEVANDENTKEGN